jgi:hypothetical protein
MSLCSRVLEGYTYRTVISSPSPAGEILGYCGQQTESGLTRIETANNWTLTVTLGTIIAVTGSNNFPDSRSLVILLGTLGLVVHFMIRSAKGYINTLRFGMISKTALISLSEDKDHNDLMDQVVRYAVEWRLPLTKGRVWLKVLTEFGYGYVISILITLATYSALHVNSSTTLLCTCTGLVIPSTMEILRFHLCSPYMKLVDVDLPTQTQG